MTKKMVLFDIDGTLLDHEKKIPAPAKEAVRSLQDELAIATGRSPYFFKGLREELGIDSFVLLLGNMLSLKMKSFIKIQSIKKN